MCGGGASTQVYLNGHEAVVRRRGTAAARAAAAGGRGGASALTCLVDPGPVAAGRSIVASQARQKGDRVPSSA